MTHAVSRSWKILRLLAGPVLLVLALLVPSAISAQWYTPQGDSGRRNTEGFGPGVSPPLSARGQYFPGEFSGLMTYLLVDSQRLYHASGWKIESHRRTEGMGAPENFEAETPLWVYELEDPSIFRHIGSIRAADDGGGAVLVGGMLVFALEELTLPLGGTTELIGLNPATGQQVWHYDLGEAIGATLLPIDGDLLVRYDSLSGKAAPSGEPRSFHGLVKSDRLIRITPGADAPKASVALHPPVDFATMVLAGNKAVLIEEDGIAGYDVNTLGRLWSYPETPDVFEPVEYQLIDTMAAHGPNVYIAQEGTRVFSLDGAGNVRWERVLSTNPDCTHRTSIATDGTALIVHGVCGDRTFGLDPATGDVRWESPVPEDTDLLAGGQPVLSAGTFYRAYAEFGFPTVSRVQALDAMTGEVRHEAGTTHDFGFTVTPMAAAGGILYAGTVHHFTLGHGWITAYETQPTGFGVHFQAPERYACGAHSGVELPITIHPQNLGPGTARDARVRLRAIGTAVQWFPPGGYSSIVSGNDLTIILGDVPAGAGDPIDLRLLPLEDGEVVLELTAEMAVRHLDPGRARDAMWFSVLGPGPEGVDLVIDWVEKTQGIQDANNSIALIAGKRTLLRAYARSSVPVERVRAEMRLSGSVDSEPFDQIVLPLENCLALSPGEPDRGDISSTFNFLIPPQILDGTPDGPFTMTISLDPEGAFQGNNPETSIYTAQLHFDIVPPVCVLNHSVRHLASGAEGEATPEDFIPWDMLRRAEMLLPTPEILQFRTGNTLEKMGFFQWVPYELDPGGSMNTTRLMATLWTHSKTTRRPRICRDHGAPAHHVGIVAENNLTTHAQGNQFNGIGFRPGWSSAFRLRTAATVDYNIPRAGVTLAHELGHNYGRRHVDCNDPSGPDRNYPYDPCTIGPVEDDAFFGTDLLDRFEPEVIVPLHPTAGRQLGDLLSYATRRWTSDYNWNAMKNRITRKQTIAKERAAKSGSAFVRDEAARAWLKKWKGSEEKYILVTASVEEGIPTIIEDVLPVSPSVVPEETALDLVNKQFAAGEDDSPYVFEVLDATGAVILTVAAEPQEIEDSEVPARTVGALIPMPDGVASIRLVEDGTPVASRERSPSAPEVELIEPAAGTVVTDVLIVDWEATDPDGNDLTTMIQYSDDDGESWITLTTNAFESPFAREAEFLPGAVGTARIRIIVNDGFNATEAVSGAFTVEPKPPLVEILQPADGETFAVGEPILLHAEAYDPEDGPLRGSALLWEIDGVGEIGTGRERILRDLTPGTHSLSVTATDSLGLFSTAEVVIFVQARSATRTEIAARLLGILGEEPELDFDLNTDGAVDSADIPHADGRP